MKHLSTTSNLLFGNLQHWIDENSWVPVHDFAGDGLNSSAGVQLQQGVDNHVPVVSVDTVSIGIPPSARFRFFSPRRPD